MYGTSRNKKSFDDLRQDTHNHANLQISNTSDLQVQSAKDIIKFSPSLISDKNGQPDQMKSTVGLIPCQTQGPIKKEQTMSL